MWARPIHPNGGISPFLVYLGGVKRTSVVAVACAFSVVACGVAFGQFTQLSQGTFARAISADGRVVVGQTSNERAFLWTAAGGQYTFGNDSDMPPNSMALGVGADGQWVVGTSPAGAFRWHGTGTFQSIVNLPPPFTGGTATGVSADGSAVSGYSGGGSGFDPIGPWYWTQSGGFQSIPVNNASAVGISRNGAVVVGTTRDSFRGFTWTPSGGVRALQAPTGSPFPTTSASAINHDGTIVIGRSGGGAPTVWRNEVPSVLPVLPGFGFVPTCLDDSGSVICGWSFGSQPISHAMIWTQGRGTELFGTFLESQGISFPTDYFFTNVTGVSADGLTFSGNGGFAGQVGAGFVVTVPVPASLALAGVALGLLARRRSR